MKSYLVGGAVRDELLNREVADRDWLVVGATPEQLLDQGYRQIGNQFPCFLHPITQDEYALARKEKKSGTGHTGFVCDFGPEVTLEEDLARRDLTINAIAKAGEGDYVDPYGGIADIHAKVLRHVSPAFVEDPLRVLRVARFAARFANDGFTVAPETLALMKTLVTSGELAQLTAERVWKEMSRALTEPTPSAFFMLLRSVGALAVILPELDELFGVPQRAQYHPEIDTGVHVMMVIDQAKKRFDNPAVTFASLLHDLGKGLTPDDVLPSHRGHENRGLEPVAQVCERLKVPNDYQQLALKVCRHHLQSHRVRELTPVDLLALIESLDAFRRPEQLVLFGQACEADACGRLGLEQNDYPQSAFLWAAYQRAAAVVVAPIIAAGFKGRDIGEQLRLQRQQAITGS